MPLVSGNHSWVFFAQGVQENWIAFGDDFVPWYLAVTCLVAVSPGEYAIWIGLGDDFRKISSHFSTCLAACGCSSCVEAVGRMADDFTHKFVFDGYMYSLVTEAVGRISVAPHARPWTDMASPSLSEPPPPHPSATKNDLSLFFLGRGARLLCVTT